MDFYCKEEHIFIDKEVALDVHFYIENNIS